MEIQNVSPFVSAEAYAVGQRDGFKAGVAVGVVAVLVVKALRNRKTKRALFCNHNCDKHK